MATGRKGQRSSGCSQKATPHRILGNLYPGLGRNRAQHLPKPAGGGVPNPSDTQCVLITQRTFSAAPPPSQAPHPYCLEAKVLAALGARDPATPVPRRTGEESLLRVRGRGEGPG